MSSLSKILHQQRLLLLSKGYTEATLEVSGQPRQFLAALQLKLQELDTIYRNSEVPVHISQVLPADFDRAKFASHLTFEYKYTPSTRTLSLNSLAVTDYSVSIHFQVNGDPVTCLPAAREVLKHLKNTQKTILQRTALKFLARPTNNPKSFKAIKS